MKEGDTIPILLPSFTKSSWTLLPSSIGKWPPFSILSMIFTSFLVVFSLVVSKSYFCTLECWKVESKLPHSCFWISWNIIEVGGSFQLLNPFLVVKLTWIYCCLENFVLLSCSGCVCWTIFLEILTPKMSSLELWVKQVKENFWKP